MSTQALRRAIATQGTQAALAMKLGISSPSISEWLRRGVPIEKCVAIEAATGGQVRVEELRSEIDWIRDPEGQVTGYQVRLAPPATAAPAAKAV